MSSSLGSISQCHSKGKTQPTPLPILAPPPATAPPASSARCAFFVPKGFVPTLGAAAIAALLPLLLIYVDFDFDDMLTRGLTIGFTALGALAVYLANDCATWYNMVLFFHIGAEVQVIDKSLAFADTASNTDMILAIVGASVVIAHLVPFLVVDHTPLLTLLAGAGVVVNTALLVYIDPSLLLLMIGSSNMLLILVLLAGSTGCGPLSLGSQLRAAMSTRMCLTCEAMK